MGLASRTEDRIETDDSGVRSLGLSRKPSVVTSAVRASDPSKTAFVITVVPWARYCTIAALTDASSSSCWNARKNPRDGSLGVEGTLAVNRCSGFVVQQHSVGERPADVNPDPVSQ